MTIALKHVNERPIPPSTFNPAVTPELEGVVLRAPGEGPGAALPDADAFIAALEHARAMLHGTGAFGRRRSPRRPTTKPRIRRGTVDAVAEEPPGRRWWLWLLGFLLIAAIGFGAFLLLDKNSGPAQVAVPDVVGADQAAATTALNPRGLRHADQAAELE